MGRCGMDSFGSGYGSVAGSCEHGNEPSAYKTITRIYRVSEKLLVSQEGLRSMQLVMYCKPLLHVF
jgi:hypothetical protein